MTEDAGASSSLLAPLRLGPHTVPGIWRHILPPGALALRPPEERRATCGDCPRVATAGYRPDYRCCTYFPRVPNFLLGLALDTRLGAEALREVRTTPFLLPEGFTPSPRQWADFLEDVGLGEYGKSTRVLCPFLAPKSGLCQIYAFRNAACSTFFCHHDHGRRGERFWEALQTLVTQVEMALAQWTLSQVGFDFDAYIRRLNSLAPHIREVFDSRTGAWTEAARRVAWGDHHGRELEIYHACAQLVRTRQDELWQLANTVELVEAARFENAALQLVAPEHQDQIEDDYDPELEPIRPAELWRTVQRQHRNLWRLPGKAVKLAPEVTLAATPERDALILSYRGGRSAARTSEPISVREAEALGLFRRKARLTPAFLQRVELASGRNPAQFVAEWLGKQVLLAV